MIISEVRQPIGLIGFCDPEDVRKVRPFASENPDRLIMVAAVATFDGKGSGRYRFPENLPELFERDPGPGPTDPFIRNTLYFDTNRQDGLSDQLDFMSREAGEDLDAIILNVPWPSPRDLETFRERHPSVGLSLKIGPEAYGLVSNSDSKLSRQLRNYHDLVERVILKPRERGEYEPFAIDTIFEIIRTLDNGSYELGFAGGLDRADLTLIEELLNEYPGLGVFTYRKLFDAEHLFCVDRAIGLLKELLKIYDGK